MNNNRKPQSNNQELTKESKEGKGCMLLVFWTCAIILVSMFWATQDSWLSSAGVYIGADYQLGQLDRAEYNSLMGQWRSAQVQFVGTWLAVWLAGIVVTTFINKWGSRRKNNLTEKGDESLEAVGSLSNDPNRSKATDH